MKVRTNEGYDYHLFGGGEFLGKFWVNPIDIDGV